MDHIETDLKCKITGNPCGTDTRSKGCPCLCENCKQWLIEHQTVSPSEYSKIIDDHFWEMF